jgi:hypothetical protein
MFGLLAVRRADHECIFTAEITKASSSSRLDFRMESGKQCHVIDA